MKKIIKSMLAIAVATFAFTSCEDVPAPYNIPGSEGEPVLPEGTYLDANFSGSNDFGFINANTKEGSQAWVVDSHGYAKGTGHISTNEPKRESQSYFISPEINLSGAEKAYLQFDYILRYVASGTENKVFLTSDYTGDPATTNWVDVTGTLTEGRDWDNWSTYSQNIPQQFLGQDKVRVAFYFACNTQNASTWEVKNVVVKEGEGNGDAPGPEEPGNTIGTAEAPITTAAAIEMINALADGASTSEKAYVKGKVVSVATNADNFAKYGNINYYISDDGTKDKQIQVYAGDGLNGEKFSSVNDIKAGDEVVVFGNLMKYVNKSQVVIPEIANSYLVSLTSGGDNPTPTPTPDESNLEAGKYFFVYKASNAYEVYAYKPFNDNSYGYMYPTTNQTSIAADGTLTGSEADLFTFTAVEGGFTLQDAQGQYFYMDDTHNSFQVSATKPASNYVWSASVAEDGKATVKNVATGKSIQFVSKYTELTATDSGEGLPLLVKQGGKVPTDGDNPNPNPNPDKTFGTLDGNTLTLTSAELGLEKGAVVPTLTLVDGTVITFDGGGNTNAPKYYEATSTAAEAVRMYPKNSFTINAGNKTVSEIAITCTNQGNDICNASQAVTIEPGSATFNDNMVGATQIGSSVVKVTNTSEATGATSQLRFSKIVITFN